ncbi:hypothetical protein EDB85DRAFT_1871917 [Lactarius pseudohatsudake]|nr:hypothetical protein EDB85DRAFT_1871917 [Lactarius pseudohatsudake]
MPCILDDPSRALCPNFEGDDWNFLRQTMIEAHPGIDPLTEEGATQRLREAWNREHDRKVAAWNEQVQQDQAEQDEADRLAQEAEDAQQAQRDREDEEQRREAEKKKPKIGSFVRGRGVSNWIEPRPAQYALNKIHNLEYVELDYFTLKGCRDAAADANKSISQDTLAFARLEDTIAVRPLAAMKTSRNIRADEELSWNEIMDAKHTMLHFMAQSGVWPAAHLESLAAFFLALELHPRRTQDHGRTVLALYQSRVRRKWFDAFKRNEGFDIEVINEAFMQALAEDVVIGMQNRRIDQVRLHIHQPSLNPNTNTILSPFLPHTLPPPVAAPPPTRSPCHCHSLHHLIPSNVPCHDPPTAALPITRAAMLPHRV